MLEFNKKEVCGGVYRQGIKRRRIKGEERRKGERRNERVRKIEVKRNQRENGT